MLPQEKKDDQKTVDTALLKAIESVPELKSYLGARFSLKAGVKPHEPWTVISKPSEERFRQEGMPMQVQ